MASKTGEDRCLPIPTALALIRAYLQRIEGSMSDAQVHDAIQFELAAHDDLALVVEAQAVIGAGILRTLETFAPEGVTADSFLLCLERDMSDGG